MGDVLPTPLGADVENWDRCYEFKNIFAQKIGEKNWLFRITTLLDYIYDVTDHNIGFQEKSDL
jgi:hypothetical protein